MKTADKLGIAGLVALILLCWFFIGSLKYECDRIIAGGACADTVRVTIVDTITYRQPVAVDSVVVRYVTARLPIAKVDTLNAKVDTLNAKVDTLKTDSASVLVPITNTEYADTAYRAWVSGYNARLDSIRVYPRTEIVTINAKSDKRWGVGLQVGVGATPRRIEPYVGIGVSYNLFTF